MFPRGSFGRSDATTAWPVGMSPARDPRRPRCRRSTASPPDESADSAVQSTFRILVWPRAIPSRIRSPVSQAIPATLPIAFIIHTRQAGKGSNNIRLFPKAMVIPKQPTSGPDLDRREIVCAEQVPMGFQKRGPSGLPLSVRCWFDAVLPQYAANSHIGE